MLGVFRNVDPSGPAAALDDALDGAIREFTLRRMFAAQLGQVFVMPAARSRLLAEIVVFAGLGDFDDFGADAQAFVAENVIRTFARTQVEDFATVLFGAGSGVPVSLARRRSSCAASSTGLRHADPERDHPPHHDLRNRRAQVCGVMLRACDRPRLRAYRCQRCASSWTRLMSRPRRRADASARAQRRARHARP